MIQKLIPTYNVFCLFHFEYSRLNTISKCKHTFGLTEELWYWQLFSLMCWEKGRKWNLSFRKLQVLTLWRGEISGFLTASQLLLLRIIKGDWQLYTFFLICKSTHFFDTCFVTFCLTVLHASLTNLLLQNSKRAFLKKAWQVIFLQPTLLI